MARVSNESAVIDEPAVQPEQEQKPKEEKTGFFQYVSELTSADWEIHIAYVYRIAPITDRLAAGLPKKYITKYSARFDEDTLKIEHGSGRYRIQLNKLDAKGHSKTIKTVEVDVEDPKFPPNVPEGEWMDDKRNDRWSWARKKKLDPEAHAATQDTWTPERVMNMVERLRPQEKKEDQISITREVLNAVKETRAELGAANNPASMIEMLKDLILITKPPAPEKQSEDSPLMRLLLSQLDAAREDAKLARTAAEAERQRNHELQLKMMESRANAADPMEMVEKVLNIQEKLGGGQGDSRNWKEKLVDQGFQALPELLGALKAIGYSRAQPPAPGAQQRPPAVNPQPPATTPQPQPTGDTVPPQQQTQQLDPEVLFVAQLFEARGGDFVAAFASDPNGGALLAETMIRYANPIYERVARAGKEKILGAIACFPQMQTDLAKVGSAEMLSDFIDDFIAGPEDDEEDDDQPDEVPEARVAPGGPAAVPRKRAPKAAAV